MSGAPWWIKRPEETEQEWANRVEDHNPSERDEVWAATRRARNNERTST